MSKVTVENRIGEITIVNRLSYPETVNERIYNAIGSGMFEGLLPVSVYQKRKETRIECVVRGLIPLSQYFNGLVTKQVFLDFVHEIAVRIKNCEKNMINANNLDLQSDKIFVDPRTQSVKCIFWPVVNNQRGTPPHLFLKQLPFELNFNPYEDTNYLQTYNAFFSGLNPFSVNNFDRMILKLSGKESDEKASTPLEGLGGRSKEYIKTEKKANIEYDPFSARARYSGGSEIEQENQRDVNGVFCTLCGAMNPMGCNSCVRCGASFPKEVSWGNDTIDLDTMLRGDRFKGAMTPKGGVSDKTVYPTLTRISTNEAFFVDKPMFRIGIEQRSCDLYVYNNTYISRNHADIITRGNRYYIVDRNSTNKTFVEGMVIPVETEVEIFKGTRIRLANEDFLFG